MRTRCIEPELMDDPALDAGEHARALRGLARINAISRSAAVLWPVLATLAREQHPRPLRVLDVATGGGDVQVALGRRARHAGLSFELHACDVSPTALTCAARHAACAGVTLHTFTANPLGDELPGGYDAVMCTLFLHHLEDAAVVTVLRRMRAAATRAVLVNDLRRSPLGLFVAQVGTRVLSRSRVVHIDGPRSVRAALTPAELQALAAQAGLAGASVTPCFPWRMRLVWRNETC